MTDFYGDAHRVLQDEFGTRNLADGLVQITVQEQIVGADAAFIEAADMFFLSTINHAGQPTVSYKGGDPGFVKIVNPTTLVFPSYDGNGMFLSMGNLAANPLIGMLFIDFQRPDRRRVQGRATVVRDHPLKVAYPEADFLVQVQMTQMWVNCPRYIHSYTKTGASDYVPRSGVVTPLAPWKRIDTIQPLLSAADQAKAAEAGLISTEQYQASVSEPGRTPQT
ncbi:MAG: pyridoxamine 5'-phosphate oxidase family protein [Proteobacteria bacterium]|nr:pyridoxamine 5'-phosphate oxidase family protein [Pseudomonadota bacterium]